MGLAWGKRILTAVVTMALAFSLASAQQPNVEDSKRKAKFKTNPAWPDLARRMGLGGRVKIELTIAADGHVKSARALGGHPVLVQPCLDAVREWKFETAPEETIQIIEFEFKQQ